MAAPPVLFDGIDTATSLLIAQLSLEDIQAGEGRVAGDEQYALQLMAEEFRDFLATYNTYQQHGPVSGGMGSGTSGSGYNSSPSSVALSIHYNPSLSPSPVPSPVPGSPASHYSPVMSSGSSAHSSVYSFLGSPFRPGSDISRSSSPVPSISSISSIRSDRTPTAECLVCGEMGAVQSFYEAPCGHAYCKSCLEQFLVASIAAESLFPPWCCSPEEKIDIYTLITTDGHALRNLDDDGVSINDDLSQRIHAKATEYAVPSKDRLYCPNPRCSLFLGSKTTLGKGKGSTSPTAPPTTKCQTCSAAVCLECKQTAHTGQKCKGNPIDGFDDASMAVRDLAKQKEWQICHGCHEMVEKTGGCNHIICRCSTQFCYRCGELWSSTHACPPPTSA